MQLLGLEVCIICTLPCYCHKRRTRTLMYVTAGFLELNLHALLYLQLKVLEVRIPGEPRESLKTFMIWPVYHARLISRYRVPQVSTHPCMHMRGSGVEATAALPLENMVLGCGRVYGVICVGNKCMTG